MKDTVNIIRAHMTAQKEETITVHTQIQWNIITVPGTLKQENTHPTAQNTNLTTQNTHLTAQNSVITHLADQNTVRVIMRNRVRRNHYIRKKYTVIKRNHYMMRNKVMKSNHYIRKIWKKNQNRKMNQNTVMIEQNTHREK